MTDREQEWLVSDTASGVRFHLMRDLSDLNASNGDQHKRFFRVCLARKYQAGSKTEFEEVVLKMPWSKDPAFIKRIQDAFEQEKSGLRNLTDSVRLIQFREEGRGMINRRNRVDYMVLNYIDGMNLRDVAQQHAQLLTPEQVIGIAYQLAEALHMIHENGIVHCDLKPSNVMLDFQTQSVVLIDFGSIWFMGQQPTKEIRGVSAEYMAPEQADPQAKLDEATDIYAFGVLLYEWFSGQRLFPGRTIDMVIDGRNITPDVDTLQQGLAKQRLLTEMLAGHEEKLEQLARLIQGCLRFEQKDRPRSAIKVMHTIIDLFAHELRYEGV
jgi:serine/threonine protein kinase